MKIPMDNFAFSASETLLFIGAGATAKLNMPTTDQQGVFCVLCVIKMKLPLPICQNSPVSMAWNPMSAIC